MAVSTLQPPISRRFIADLLVYRKEKPYELWLQKIPEGATQTNVVWVDTPGIKISDMREHSVGLESTGFTYINSPSSCLPRFAVPNGEGISTLLKDTTVEAYLTEAMAVVKKELGDDILFVQDWRVRR